MSEDEIEDALPLMRESGSAKARALADLWEACSDTAERRGIKNVFWHDFDYYIRRSRKAEAA